MWERFCDALGAPELMRRPEFATRRAAKNRDALNAEIDELTVKRSSAEWSSDSTRPACRAGRSTRSTRCSPIRRSSICGSRSRSSRREGGSRDSTLVGQPVTLSRTPSHLVAPPPERGEHTDAVLEEFGFDAKAIACERSRASGRRDACNRALRRAERAASHFEADRAGVATSHSDEEHHDQARPQMLPKDGRSAGSSSTIPNGATPFRSDMWEAIRAHPR